ncbi:beta-glucosidase [Auriculariales sp. MPI-PUGE-AT-0066]|nr:beta-glucosidase [Auriculariales sp. MPI-PUGE-AT-0066]
MSKTLADFIKADPEVLAGQLTHDEAVSLIAGVDFWNTAAVPRLGIPSLKVSDGPNGVRGERFFMGTPAKCLPSATALGATWNPALIHAVGEKIIVPEAKRRLSSVLLGPTINIQRSPLGGRSFESFSEDPHLSGTICAAYVNGVQAGGVAATVKHFVCNDQENDRMGNDSVVSPRAFRELYLMPFMIAQRDAKPWAYMSAYNRINGLHASENKMLLTDILRGEWGHDGLVMSDWFGVYSVDASIKAGLDLEMPGVRKWRNDNLIERCIASHKLAPSDIRERAKVVIKFVHKCAKALPEILEADLKEVSEDTPEEIALLRRAAAESIVLLRNEGGILPLDKSKVKKVAIIGPNAKGRIYTGGGSAALRPSFVTSPYEGIVAGLGKDVEVTYAEGTRSFRNMPTLDYDLFSEDGKPGWTLSWYPHSATEPMTALPEPVRVEHCTETYALLADAKTPGLTERWTIKLRGFLAARERDTEFEFGLTVAGRGKMYVDGTLVVDNWTRQRRGTSFFGRGTEEERGKFTLKAGVKHEVLVEFVNVKGPADGDEDQVVLVDGSALRLGGAAVLNLEEEIVKAEKAAKDADVVIVVVGLNGDYETEGEDRITLALPGRTNELVRRINAVNPRTVVVNQSGSAVELPWADDVAGLLHSWYLGNCSGDAIADVLLGAVNPAARLSLTFPRRMRDVPSYGNFGTYSGTTIYGEDLFVGYKHYVDRQLPSHFPFGFGLSYTTFVYSDLTLSTSKIAADTSAADIKISASVRVCNTGTLPGSHVVQLYVAPPVHPLGEPQPSRALRGYTRVEDLAPDAETTATVVLDKYAFSAWEPFPVTSPSRDSSAGRWIVRKGAYGVLLCAHAEEVVYTAIVNVEKDIYWSGL